jgi:hypothetical protein
MTTTVKRREQAGTAPAGALAAAVSFLATSTACDTDDVAGLEPPGFAPRSR